MFLKLILTISALVTTTISKNVFGDGYSKLDFQIETRESSKDSTHTKNLFKREDNETSPIILQDLLTFFTVNITLGTPGQEMKLALGTGTSDTWVTGKDNPYCKPSSSTRSKRSLNKEDGIVNKEASNSASSSIPTSSATIDCELYGVFDKDSSETFHSNDTNFLVSYTDDTYVSGDWSTDTLRLGDFELENYSFGLAERANALSGVLALGFEAAEGTNRGRADPNRNYTYPNFPTRLRDEGYIKKKIYSLYLDSYNSTKGSILFGAIDHAKYSGSLITLPVINPYETYGFKEISYFAITVSGIGTDVEGNQTTFSSKKYPAIVDAGTTLTYLPVSIMDEVASAFGADYSYYYGGYVMDCPTLKESLSQFLVFDLSGHKFNIPLYQLIRYRSSNNRCTLSMYDSYDSTITFGASFLRSIYTVFDLDDYQMSFAQAKYTQEEDIEIIEDSIPSASSAPNYDKTWSTYGYQFTTSDIFSDEDDGTTVVDVFGYTGGSLQSSFSVRALSTKSTLSEDEDTRTGYGAGSTGDASDTSSATDIGRSTVQAESTNNPSNNAMDGFENQLSPVIPVIITMMLVFSGVCLF